MKIIQITILTLISYQSIASDHYKKTSPGKVKEAKFYGAAFTEKKVQPIKTVLADFNKYKGKKVLVEAKVGKVCASKGCWMVLESKDIRVKFKDYAFFVPMSLIGKTVQVEGVIKETTLTKEEAAHYAEDAGIKNPKNLKLKEYSMMASGVKPAS
jgi:hypothetical protein